MNKARRPDRTVWEGGFCPHERGTGNRPRVSADKIHGSQRPSGRRRIIQVSALSALDGSVLGYHGGDG